MRITEPTEGENAEVKIELIEKTSGKVMVDLGTAYPSHLSDTVLLWSADFKVGCVRHPWRARRRNERLFLEWFGLR